MWEHSSAGRASALQAEGHRFEPYCSHQLFGPVVQLVRTLACHARGRRFEPVPGRQIIASVAQLVEQRTENPRVVGSIPTGGTICGCSSSGRAPPCQGGGGGFEPRNPLQNRTRSFVSDFYSRRHSQAVRQRSAKPLFPSSILGGASRKQKAHPVDVLFVFWLTLGMTCWFEQ